MLEILLFAALDGGRILPVEEMTARAEVVGLAVVQGASCRIDPRNGMIYTDYPLVFREVWKGLPPEPFVLTKAGGTVGDRSAAIAGEDYTLQPGETLVVFARKSALGSHVVLGIRQGLYRLGPDLLLARETGTSTSLPALREQVRRTVEPESPSTSPAAAPTTREPRADVRPATSWAPAVVFAGLLLVGLAIALRRRS